MSSLNATSSTLPYALSLTVTGTSGSLTHTGSTTLLINLAAPSNVAATAGSGSQISTSWSASFGATSYHIYRSLFSGGPYEGVACTTSTSYTDTGLRSNTAYYYVVAAQYTGGPNAGGESTNTSEATATTLTSGGTLALSASPTFVSVAQGSQGTSTITSTYHNEHRRRRIQQLSRALGLGCAYQHHSGV